MTELELHWLAGLLEGEGYFLKPPPSSPNNPRLGLQMTDLDTVERAKLLMSSQKIYSPKKRKAHWKDVFQTHLSGAPAIALMKQLYPLMGSRRRQRLDEIFAIYQPRKPGDNTRKLTPEQIVEIKNLILLKQESTDSIGARFGVSGHLIRLIRSGKVHHHDSSRVQSPQT